MAYHIEEMALTAWPCFQQDLVDGWILRFADGYTFRSNSVQPFHSGADVEEKIGRCEELYFQRGLPTAFKISPIVQPPDLDSVLESRGYRKHTPTSVQVLDVLPESQVNARNADVRCMSLSEWLDAFSIISALPAEKKPLHAGIVERISPPMYTVAVYHEGQPAACGLGVLQDGCVGLYDICTVPSMRRMGLASKIIQALFVWASDNGASSASLSVVEANAPAVSLYRKLGFRHVYSYWYRIKDRQDL